MQTRLKKLLAVVATALAALAMMAMPASAQDPYPPSQAFSVTCTDTGPGETITCTIVGAQPGEVLAFTITAADGRLICEGTVTADEDGEATFTCDIPDDVLGDLLITVSGPESGTTTTTVESAPPAAVDDDRGEPVAAAGPSLPMTGGEVAVLLSVGIALLGGGLLALRRREDAKVRG